VKLDNNSKIKNGRSQVMELLQEIEGIYSFDNGQVFVSSWGPGLLIEDKDFGGIELLPKDFSTTTIGPWLGTNGDDRYRVFVLPESSLVELMQPPTQEDVTTAEKMPSIRPKAEVIQLPVVEKQQKRIEEFFEAVAAVG
jgi:hypothetical protein